MASVRNLASTGGYHDIHRNHRRGTIRQAAATVNWREIAWWLIVAAVIIGCELMWRSEPDAEQIDRSVYIGATTDAPVDAGVDYK